MPFHHSPIRSNPRAEYTPLSVSEITARIKLVLEGSFPSVWVVGEISNFSRPRSGHCYLTLKDERAQLRAVVWRSTAAGLRFELEDGLEVVCHGAIDLYAARGSYQLVIDQMHPRGMGALELRLRQLRDKLGREGLFAPERKRPLPRFPRCVALVTSPTGAAVRDFLEVLRRRWRGTDVLVVPVRVQGDGAAHEIVAAIELVNRLTTPIDVLVVARGGGSLEDLWTFNEEQVVRAIHASRIPVVSAVGHEIDVTLCDLVADLRALTPSEAAERVVPSLEETASQLAALRLRMAGALRVALRAKQVALASLSVRAPFRKPLDRLHDQSRRLDELSVRARRAVIRQVERSGLLLAGARGKLDSLSPQRVLARGYSVTLRQADGLPVTDAARLQVEERLETLFARGRATSRVEHAQSEPPTRQGAWRPPDQPTNAAGDA